jgi:hypothetical protein
VSDKVVVIGDKLSPVSLLPAINSHRFHDSHGIYENLGQSVTASVNDTSNILSLLNNDIASNLSPVSFTPVKAYRQCC